MRNANKTSKVLDVALGFIRFSSQTQRELRQYRVDTLLSDFELNRLGIPTLNFRDCAYYCMDGQHRIVALKSWLGDGWEKQKIACEVFDGFTEAEEAEMFLRLNDKLSVGAFDKFNMAVTAARPDEIDIKKTVEKQGLCISKSKTPGSIGSVSSLRKVYRMAGPEGLGRSLRLIRDSFGDAGFEARVIEGMGLLCKRYNGQLDEQVAKDRLAATRGGVKGLLGRAGELHLRTGNATVQCIAAAAVDIINAGKSGHKLPSWWKA